MDAGSVAAFFPVRHLIQACQSVFLPQPLVDGAGWEPGHLLVMALWGVGAAAIAHECRWCSLMPCTAMASR